MADTHIGSQLQRTCSRCDALYGQESGRCEKCAQAVQNPLQALEILRLESEALGLRVERIRLMKDQAQFSKLKLESDIVQCKLHHARHPQDDMEGKITDLQMQHEDTEKLVADLNAELELFTHKLLKLEGDRMRMEAALPAKTT